MFVFFRFTLGELSSVVRHFLHFFHNQYIERNDDDERDDSLNENGNKVAVDDIKIIFAKQDWNSSRLFVVVVLPKADEIPSYRRQAVDDYDTDDDLSKTNANTKKIMIKFCSKWNEFQVFNSKLSFKT